MRLVRRPAFAGLSLTPADLAPAQPVAVAKAPLTDRITTTLDNAGNWIQTNADSMTRILDAVGRLRQSGRTAEVRVSDSYDYNVRQPITANWFGRETIWPGASNGLVVVIAVALVVGLPMLVSRGNS